MCLINLKHMTCAVENLLFFNGIDFHDLTLAQ